MNKDRILGFAVEFACREVKRQHCNYTSPWPVAPLEISKIGEDWIKRLVGDGIRAAIAREQGDEARALLAHETVKRLRVLVRMEFGKAVSADDLFTCGYRAVRGD